ncbi:MAG: hypothetical protein OXD49_02070 [Candidatus Poribacteria bacterium]|nr:hypothetical protein [Candidatus Poribacteria bacterium]
MKYLVLLTTLIALLSCGSGSNPVAPNPSMDTSQSAEKNELSVVGDPLVVPPEVMVEPPVRVIAPPEVVDPEIEAIIEAIVRDLPEPPEVEADPPPLRIIIEPPNPPELPEGVADPPVEIIIEAIVRDLPEPPEDPPDE